VKIGYPEKFETYQNLMVDPTDAIGNLLAARRFGYEKVLKDLNQPVDKKQWGMTPQTVNAYYNPLGNEIVFPAAILQPPFFDMNRDDAYNYGGIGAVIGHEISHGFDDEGRQFDAKGRLRDWWQEADTKAFNQRIGKLAAQYNSYEPLPGAKVNGELTMGENIADLAGVAMAQRAYHLAYGQGQKQDGLTPDQRFFYGYGLIWRSKSRPEWLKVRLATDPHSPEQYRVNGVLSNIDSFYAAFGLKPKDKMYKTTSDRIRIW
jgi:putative endopeptidase